MRGKYILKYLLHTIPPGKNMMVRHGSSLTQIDRAACEIHAVTTAAAATCKQFLQYKMSTVARNKKYELKSKHMS